MNTARLYSVQTLSDWVESHQRDASWGAIAIASIIAIVDWEVGANVSLGFLYVFAILAASFTMPRAGLIIFALACAVLREAFGPFRWQPAFEVRLALVGAAFGGMGLLVSELNRNRKLVTQNLRQREQFLVAQQASERQLSTLVNTCPLPILIADDSGTVIVANQACHALFEVSPDGPAANLLGYLPELKDIISDDTRAVGPIRREVECSGITGSGEPFFAHVWLTKYLATSDSRIAVVLWDASEDLRGRELANVQSMMATSRMVVAGFAHEVKNMVAVIRALSARLAERCALEADGEYLGITSTLDSLSSLSASALKTRSEPSESAVDLSSTMKQIRIVLHPVLDGAGVEVEWDLPELPRVRADHTALLQVFLNLARNSERATRLTSNPRFTVKAATHPNLVTITVSDNGPGVMHPEHLFKPFRSTAGGSGLGLYMSRATLRACGGDLWYESRDGGACFQIRLLEA
jgi:nitrogen-specific signal transduction histidine kinase